MDVVELNDLLKTVVEDIIEEWDTIPGIRHKVSKILLGAHGQAAINKWMAGGSRETPFGVKPLSKIGSLLDYDINLAFVKKGSKDANTLHKLNIDFVKEFKTKVIEYLQDQTNTAKTKKSILTTPRSNSVVNQVLDTMLKTDDSERETTKADEIPNLDPNDPYFFGMNE
jgi:hypothetical protein